MKIFVAVLVGIWVIGLLGFYPVSAQRRLGPQTPENVDREFYKWYITAVDRGVDPFTKGRTTLKKICNLSIYQGT
ncbi:MAG: hypothetical protein ACRERV_16190 [Methylococcales bacterium]